MLTGLSGSLLPASFAESTLGTLFAGEIGEASRERAHRGLLAWWERSRATLGPATGVRSLVDRAAVPLFRQLGFRIAGGAVPCGPHMGMLLACGDQLAAIAAVAAWDSDLGTVWREAVRHGITVDARWAIVFNGRQLRLTDARRLYGPAHLDFDLDAAAADRATFAVLWATLRSTAFLAGGTRPARSLLERVLDAASQHARAVCGSLEAGVHDALIELLTGLLTDGARVYRKMPARGGRPLLREPSAVVFEQALTIVYRILFLLFAESRRLVPIWHPLYRDSYTIEALRQAVEMRAETPGLWEALQAISRLAHQGCRAGGLRMTGFNGRLFAPERTPVAERGTVPDGRMRAVLLALTTRRARYGRERISFADLGVEQLGSVYERVLDFVPVVRTAPMAVTLESRGGRRKATGTFYTPRGLTDYLVRRTLTPLVAEASPDDILRLRILDPAMGSGAFLVSACRFLAAAYEAALVRTGVCRATDVTDADRAAFRRTVAQRSLYGVDLNPMAVQLARLSLWLATLAGDRPLTFLDHRLRVGDSLVGASLDDIARQPGVRSRRHRPAELSLFTAAALEPALRSVLPVRDRLEREPDDTPAAVREKERVLAQACGSDSPLARWKAVADLWCAGWFTRLPQGRSSAIYRALADELLAGAPPARVPALAARREDAARLAASRRFFHWSLEFPEAFFDARGRPLARPGFDAVIGNPPWEMLRADQGTSGNERHALHAATRPLVDFARSSGVYSDDARGHPNCYQLFLERTLQLVRAGGRFGVVMPGGLLADHGSAGLRRRLLETCTLDPVIGFENRARIFPIHRDVRFVLLTSTSGGTTPRLVCRFGERDPAILERFGDSSVDATFPLSLTRAFIERISGPSLAIPDLRTELDIAILDRVTSGCRPLGHPEGWNLRFGRELNASEDARLFERPERAMPVLEGKCLHPFRVDLAAARHSIEPSAARRALGGLSPFDRHRLGYRDVASPRNRLTLIAAMIPAGAVTTHTIFCLRTPLPDEAQWFLCGVLNSLVANYLVRLRVITHVTVGIVEGLPVPKPDASSSELRQVAALAARCARTAVPPPDTGLAEIHARVAKLYGLTEAEFDHVLGTFPLLPVDLRRAAAALFQRGAL